MDQARPAVTDPEVDALLRAGRASIEAGEATPARFVIPTGAGRYRLTCADLQAAGQNDLGIPPRAFAYAAVGMLLASLGGQRCYVSEPAISAAAPKGSPPDTAGQDPSGQDPGGPRGPGGPGDAAHDAAGRDAPGPSQPAVVVSVFGKGLLEAHVQRSARNRDGRLLWEKPALRSTAEPGALGSALPLWRAVNREPSPLPPPEQLIEDMRESGFVIEVET